MESHDIISAMFESVGAVASWLNVRAYLKDREVKGVVWSMAFFWVAWGIWNLYFYPSLNQWFSFYAGIVLCLGNLVWLCLIVFDKIIKK